MHGRCTHTCGRLCRLVGLDCVAPPRMDNWWSRLRRVYCDGEQNFPASGIPGVTAIMGLWLSTGTGKGGGLEPSRLLLGVPTEHAGSSFVGGSEGTVGFAP